jgi:signal transduction histidine kinase
MLWLPHVFSNALGRVRAIPLARRILFATALLLAAVYCGNAFILAHYYYTVAARERSARETKAALLAEHAGRALAQIDLSLDTIADALKKHLPLKQPSVFTQHLLDKYHKQLPEVRTLGVIGLDGRIVNTTKRFPPPSVNLADRPYFAVQKKRRGVGFYVGRDEISRVDHEPFFGVSRPILDKHGDFDGIVLAVVEPRYFASYYGTDTADSYDGATDDAILLERDDGSILAGTTLSPAAFRDGDRYTSSRVDRSAISARQVHGFPLKVVVIGKPVLASPQFIGLISLDAGLLIAMTVIALWLAVKAAREAAAQSLFIDALEYVPSALMLCDRDDRIIFCNSATRRYFPTTSHLLTPGTRFEDLLRAHAASYVEGIGNDFEAWIAERMKKHLAGDTNIVRQYADGRWSQIAERRTGTGYTISIRTDITDLKQIEEALRRSEQAARAAREDAEQANRTKSAFLAHMSHELRTPLNAIIGFSEMIEQRMMGPISETYRQYGEIVHTSAHHLLSIINDILDIAKLNSGKTELHLEPTEVNQTILDAVDIISGRAETAGVTIVSDLCIAHTIVEADPVRLRQVLLNVLTNAIKFTPPGGRVKVATSVGPAELQIIVRDTGKGIAPEDIPRALEPFTQVGTEKGGVREGTGLGLPISKMLVELHGGRFTITSALNVGTTVTIRLPVQSVVRPVATELDVAV